MDRSPPLWQPTDPTLRAAAVGAAAGGAVHLHHVLTVGTTQDLPFGAVLVASLLAGFLARRNGGTSRAAGVNAAAIAIIPIALTVAEPIRYLLETYGTAGLGRAAVFLLPFTGFVIVLVVAIGTIGGWLGGLLGTRRTTQPMA